MFKFYVEEELSCKIEGTGKFIAKKGAMVAFKGNFKFDKMLLGPDNGGGVMGSLLGLAKRKLTGENIELMTVEGSGIIYLAKNAYHVSVFELEPGDCLSVESENLLAFPTDLKYDIRFIGSGVLSQKGLATTVLSNFSNLPQQVAVITDGNPLMLEAPCVVDPDAVVAWTSGPNGGGDPSVSMNNFSWKTAIGQTSGESYQFQFNQTNQMVLVQPSERLSGLKVSID
ncbi:AIM24 family protein [Desulfosporosinus nitroreducens]|uniref:AIM24 family protein n=1 Tax=Desulfosporosinus nitroreducens TaxID=2018668 RepID=A0ABT8QS14_9FIRM|nr:AIM24 family protein [Desulfosporosinus nitroreducens]MCO1602543.1 AIM24 family protein [Desulfosporosinus nitroreducens]MDO0824121.1 AIM24 family protein [Desulfosporosinus nitroreducens]